MTFLFLFLYFFVDGHIRALAYGPSKEMRKEKEEVIVSPHSPQLAARRNDFL